MKFSVDKNWWKSIFDKVYLLTDARTVCDAELTAKEVDFITTFLDMETDSAILDLCGGQGRHSLELARRGFTDLTVLDYSGFLLEIGREKAQNEKLNIQFVQADARYTNLPHDRFQFIILMASSFGYFTDERENRKILTESFRLLVPGGQLLLDIPDRDYIIGNLKPSSYHRVNDDISVERKRHMKGNVIFSKETVVSDHKGCIRENKYCMRLYSRDNLKKLLMKEGFKTVMFKKDFMNRTSIGDFGCMTNRVVAIAKKG
jgi:D-alanine-D-alanine ligase